MMRVVFAVAATLLAGAAVAQQTPNAPPAGDSMMQPAPTDPAMAPAPGMQPGMTQPDMQPGMMQPGTQSDTGMAQPTTAGEGQMAMAPATGNLPMCSRTVRDSCQQSAAMERRAISAAQDARRMGRRSQRPM